MLCGKVDAATISLSQDFSFGGDLATDEMPAPDNQLPNFNPALGTLTAVDLQITGQLQWSQEFYAQVIDPSQPGILRAFGSATAYVVDPNGKGLAQALSDPQTQDGTFQGQTGAAFAPDFAFSFDLPADPSLFLNNSVYFYAWPFAGDLCGANCDAATIDDAYGVFGGTVTTVFTYRPANSIPEPSAMPVFLLGAAALAGFRMRRSV